MYRERGGGGWTEVTTVTLMRSGCCFRPDLIQYDKLHKSSPIQNLQNSFSVAEEKLGLTALLEAEGRFCCAHNINKKHGKDQMDKI